MNQQFEMPTILRTRETHWRDLRQARSDGRVERVRRGFYVTVSRDRPAWEVARDRELAAIAAAAAALSCAYAFSHTTAARLLGLSTGPWDGVVHITTRRRHGSTARAGVQRHFSADPPTEFGAVGGLTTTIVERTIIDCARTLHPREALIVADSGLRRLAQMNRFERIESEQRQPAVRSALLALVEHGVGRPGFARAGIVLGNADGFSESPGESGCVGPIWPMACRPPICQLEVPTHAGVFYPDHAWRLSDFPGHTGEIRVLAEEYDGVAKYQARDDAVAARVLHTESRRDHARRSTGVFTEHRVASDVRRTRRDRLALDLQVQRLLARTQTAVSPRPSRPQARPQFVPSRCAQGCVSARRGAPQAAPSWHPTGQPTCEQTPQGRPYPAAGYVNPDDRNPLTSTNATRSPEIVGRGTSQD